MSHARVPGCKTVSDSRVCSCHRLFLSFYLHPRGIAFRGSGVARLHVTPTQAATGTGGGIGSTGKGKGGRCRSGTEGGAEIEARVDAECPEYNVPSILALGETGRRSHGFLCLLELEERFGAFELVPRHHRPTESGRETELQRQAGTHRPRSE